MRYPVSFVLVFILYASFISCKRNHETLPDLNFYNDNYEVGDVIYSVPSPHQISLLIKDDCSLFNEEIFNKFDVRTFSTSEKKAMVFGALITDLGYMSLFDQKNLTLQYLDKIRYLMENSNSGLSNLTLILNRIENNFGKSDSIISILTEIHRKECETIRTSERPYLGSLVIAGGWIESFYILNNLYDKTKNSSLFGLLLQQQQILNNILELLRPYYNKNEEYTELIDKLVEIAYEYEVIDTSYKNFPPINNDSTTYIRCKFTPTLTGSHLERIYQLSGALRKNIIY